MKRTIAIANDHAGYEMKKVIAGHLIDLGYVIKDFGADTDEPVDYPDYAHPMAFAVEKGEFDLGISLCGSGNGINMVTNKHQKIRAAICWNEEITKLARAHNDANICSIPARFVSRKEAINIVDTFLNTAFEGGRHLKRIKKIPIQEQL